MFITPKKEVMIFASIDLFGCLATLLKKLLKDFDETFKTALQWHKEQLIQFGGKGMGVVDPDHLLNPRNFWRMLHFIDI